MAITKHETLEVRCDWCHALIEDKHDDYERFTFDNEYKDFILCEDCQQMIYENYKKRFMYE